MHSDISNVTSKLSKTDELVFKELRENNNLTREEIAININKIVRTVQKLIDKSKQSDKIKRIRNKNSCHREIIGLKIINITIKIYK